MNLKDRFLAVLRAKNRDVRGMRTLVIGDIHGCLSSLRSLLHSVSPTEGDTFIFLGDYVDRGPDSKGVIDILIELKQEYPCVFLTGNHEEKMLLSRVYDFEIEAWLADWDAQATLDSYGSNDIESVPDTHWEFLRNCQSYIEYAEHIFVHACVEADLPISQQQPYTLIHKKLKHPQSHISGKTVVCGHTAQKSHRPLYENNTICIDTDAGRDGWLTCLHLESYKYWQVNEKGDTREASLT